MSSSCAWSCSSSAKALLACSWYLAVWASACWSWAWRSDEDAARAAVGDVANRSPAVTTVTTRRLPTVGAVRLRFIVPLLSGGISIGEDSAAPNPRQQMASLYAHTTWSGGNLAVDAGVPAAGNVSRPRAIATCQRRRPGTADGTPTVQSNRSISAAPASRSGRRHAGGPKRSRRVSGTGVPKRQTARRRPEAAAACQRHRTVAASCQLGPPPSSLRKWAVVFGFPRRE